MMRVNLLPPDILERRKAEKRVGWVVLAAIGVAVVLAIVWAVGYFQLQGKRDELASVQQQTQLATAQANQLAIFEQRATELETRRATAAQALAGRVNWARLFDELSLVLPSDVWLKNMMAEEGNGLQLQGFAVDAPNDTPDAGHKTMAKTLVRLADLQQLSDVWLTSSKRTDYKDQPAIEFSVKASISASESVTP